MELTTESTSSITQSLNKKIIDYLFGEYKISVWVDDSNKFIGIESIGVNKAFYSHRSVKEDFDARKYYEE